MRLGSRKADIPKYLLSQLITIYSGLLNTRSCGLGLI
jgi:hypothetical protein